MSMLTSQERGIIIFLLSTAAVGSIIGMFRHNWLSNPEILISPNNLPEVINALNEQEIIQKHNISISQSLVINSTSTSFIEDIVDNESIASKSKLSDVVPKNTFKTKSNVIKKSTTQNPSRIININSASKDDFISLPYIGEVKAELIIQLRNEIGGFKSLNDLEKVKGIGPKTFLKMEPFITI